VWPLLISQPPALPEAERERILKETAAMLDSPVLSLDTVPITSEHYEIVSEGQAIPLGTA
jgi:hypothetical protein